MSIKICYFRPRDLEHLIDTSEYVQSEITPEYLQEILIRDAKIASSFFSAKTKQEELSRTITEARLEAIRGIFDIIFEHRNNPQNVTARIYSMAMIFCPYHLYGFTQKEIAELVKTSNPAMSQRREKIIKSAQKKSPKAKFPAMQKNKTRTSRVVKNSSKIKPLPPL